MPSPVLPLAVASNAAYLPGLLVTLGSAVGFCGPEQRVRAFVLDTGLTEADWAALKDGLAGFGDRLRLDRVPADLAPLASLPSGPGGNHSAYARLLLPDLVDVGRVVYLDVDFLVLRDLAVLLDLDLEGHPIAAVRDRWVPSLSWDWEDRRDTRGGPAYFNSGFLVCDLDAWRDRDFTRRAVDFLATHGLDADYHDQTALNVLFEGDVLHLDADWNRHGRLDFARLQRGDLLGTNVHFAGCNPWMRFEPDLPGALWYRAYALLSGRPDALAALGLSESRKAHDRRLRRLVRKRLFYELTGQPRRLFRVEAELARSRYDADALCMLERRLEHRLVGGRRHT